MRADAVALAHPGVDAHRAVTIIDRHPHVGDGADRGQEIARRVLCVNARLDRMPADRKRIL